MKPIDFPESNKIGVPSGRQYSDNVAEVKALPMWTDGEQCVSLWKLSLRERIQILLNGTLWLQVLSGNKQPPIAFWAGRRFFQHPKEQERIAEVVL